MKRVKFAIFAIFILMVVATTLFACSEKTSTVTQTATTTTTVSSQITQTATTTQTTTVSSQTTPSGVKLGGILKIAIAGDGQKIGDPNVNKREDALMQRAAMEYLGRFDNTVTLQPYLADSWQGDPANKTFTVKLKKGIKFHDGTDFNAAAVKWNWEHCKAASSGYTKRVDSIDVVDDYTVRVNLTEWDADIATSLCYWAGPMASPTAWQTNGAEWGEKNPIGTGPFKFVEWVRNTKVTYTRFDDYWQKGKPYLDGIEFHIIVDATVSEAAFRAGDVDSSVMLPSLNANNLKKEGNYVIDECGAVGVMFHSLYTDSGTPDSIFADVNVRKALGYAIDREKIVKNVLLGYGKVTNQKALPGDWCYNPNMEGQMYDPAKAREVLTLAGHPNGIKTTLTVMSPFSSYMEAVQAQFIESGIDAELRVLAPEGWRHEFEVGWTGILHCIEPPGIENAVKFTLFTSDSAFMPCILRPPEIETLMTATRAAADFATKQKLVWEGQAKIYDEFVLQTPLWVEPALAASYQYVHDAGFMKAAIHEFTPEVCWIDK